MLLMVSQQYVAWLNLRTSSSRSPSILAESRGDPGFTPFFYQTISKLISPRLKGKGMNIQNVYQLADIVFIHKIATADFIFLCIFTIFIIIAALDFWVRWLRLRREGKIINKQEIRTLVVGTLSYIAAIVFYLYFNRG